MTDRHDFFHFNELFLNIGAVNSPSEVHGMLCGRMLAKKDRSDEDWLTVMIEFMDIGHVALTDELRGELVLFLKHADKLIDDDEFTFNPLLPSDDSTIERRATELGAWCEGFLHGMGASGLNFDAKLSADSADAIRDLAQISQIEVNEEDDENERHYAELVEYVKVAVLTIFHEVSQRSQESPTMH